MTPETQAPVPPPPPSVPPGTRPLLERTAVRVGIAALLLAGLVGLAVAIRPGGGSSSSPPVAVATGTPPSDAGLGPVGGGSPVLKQPAPDFALRSADGSIVKLSDYRGKVVWINFWASWCVPCKRELPDIQALYNEKRDQGLVVLTVNYQEDIPTAKDFFAQHGVSLPVLMDTDGRVYDAYRLRGLPDSFFVGRDGTLQAQQFGYLTADIMRQRLATAGIQ